jgi:hypothetical protein
MLQKARMFIAAYVLGIALILGGLSFYIYATGMISDLQAKLSTVAVGQGNYYSWEGSLQWWQNETLTVYGPLAFYLILAGVAILFGLTAYAAWAASRNRPKNRKIKIDV